MSACFGFTRVVESVVWIATTTTRAELVILRRDGVGVTTASDEYDAARLVRDGWYVHPLQLDVIERCVTLWSNPGEVVLTPFMGVGSEVYGAVRLGRRGIGVELKPSYYRQAVRNVAHAQTEALENTRQGAFDFGDAKGDAAERWAALESDADAAP